MEKGIIQCGIKCLLPIQSVMFNYKKAESSQFETCAAYGNAPEGAKTMNSVLIIVYSIEIVFIVLSDICSWNTSF